MKEAGTAKDRLRTLFRRRRMRLLDAAQPGILDHARGLLVELDPAQGRVGIYWPLAGEADLRPLGGIGTHPLALPAVRARTEAPASRSIVYLPWRHGDRLQPDACAIPAPAPSAGHKADLPLTADQLTLLLVPALAIDRRGYRLGYGGGWYDRLRSDPGWRKVPALAVLPAGCLSEPLPDDPWDIPFQGWLDEQGPHWCE